MLTRVNLTSISQQWTQVKYRRNKCQRMVEVKPVLAHSITLSQTSHLLSERMRPYKSEIITENNPLWTMCWERPRCWQALNHLHHNPPRKNLSQNYPLRFKTPTAPTIWHFHQRRDLFKKQERGIDKSRTAAANQMNERRQHTIQTERVKIDLMCYDGRLHFKLERERSFVGNRSHAVVGCGQWTLFWMK